MNIHFYHFSDKLLYYSVMLILETVSRLEALLRLAICCLGLQVVVLVITARLIKKINNKVKPVKPAHLI